MHLRTTLRFESRETLQALAVHDEPTQTRIFAMPERHRRHRHRLSPRVSYYIHFVLIGIVFAMFPSASLKSLRHPSDALESQNETI